MAFHYNELAILTLFRSENRGVNQPSLERLQTFDTEMRTRFEEILVEKMTEAEIPLSRENRSRVLMFAIFSNGSDAVRVRNSCRYFNNVMGLDLS